MRAIFIFVTLFFFCGRNLRAQNIDSVSKIVISYFFGHNSLSQGEYAHSEIIEFVRVDSVSFVNSQYILIKYREKKDGYGLLQDTIIMPVNRNAVTITSVGNLLKELNANKDNFTAKFVLPYLKRPTKEEIRHIASKCEYDVDDYDRNERRIMFKKIKHFYLFDSFLLSLRLDTAMRDIIVIGEGDVSNIKIISGDNTSKYICRFSDALGQPHLIGQPVEREDNFDYLNSRQVINMEIIPALENLLPAQCFLREQVDFNSITKWYIKWFVENHKG